MYPDSVHVRACSIGTIYYKMDNSWKAVNSRAALLFFLTAFLTFMSISGFPAFQEDMQVGDEGGVVCKGGGEGGGWQAEAGRCLSVWQVAAGC
jgi:hypothetical protein